MLQPAVESPPWDLPVLGVPVFTVWADASGDAGVGENKAAAACAGCSGAVTVSSSMGVSCEPPRTDEELESGGTDPERQLGAGLHSPDTLGEV